MRPFGCPVTILNTIDHLGKFDGKADEGFFVGYSLNSKAFRVFNSRTRIVEENLHIRFSENTPNVVGSGPDWLFDIDALTRIMNYEPIVVGTQSNGFPGIKASDNAGQARKETKPVKNYILLPLWTTDPPYSQDSKSSQDDGFKPSSDDGKKVDEGPRSKNECNDQEKEDNVNCTNNVIIFNFSGEDEDVGAEADMNNLDTTIQVSPILTTRIHKDHPLDQFWSTAEAKTINREVQLHALVDGKKVIITESTVRRDLQLEDAEGVDCLPNATIFEQLTLMGYEKISQKLTFYKAFFSPQWKFLIHTSLQCLSSKTTAWNEFSSTMASAIIYKQLEGMPTHNRIYIAPSHTKKIFRNMKRVGKGFSGRVTPLFPTMMVQAQEEMGEGFANPTDPQHTPTITQPSSSQPQKKQKPRKPREDTRIPQSSCSIKHVADEAVYEERDDLWCQETMGDIIAQTRFDNVSKTSSDSLLAGVNIPQSDEDSIKLKELMRLEKKGGLRTHKLKRLYKIGSKARVASSCEESLGEKDASKQGRKISVIDDDADITLVSVHEDVEMFDVNDLHGEEVLVDQEVLVKEVSAAATITTKEITLAQVLVEIKTSKPKVRGIVFQEPSESTTTTISSKPSQDKGKAKMVEEPVKSTKRKVQIRLDEEAAQRLQAELQAELEEEKRLVREKEEEANIALIESWDNVQATIDADYQMAEQLQAQEQEELTIEEKSKLFQQLLETRRKHFAAKRAEEKRNKPPTKAQQRSIIEKRAGEELMHEVVKKQKVNDDQEAAKMKELMEIVSDEEEVAIDAIPLATKPLSIVDWKILKEGKISYF
ncbi:ribonuclease H-like domain-containing protein [Tanacetum coccineum]